ncbi:MAG: formate dehydrogenase accessory sulfurtransferase FdhD [Gammaproteobacteria bacterium]|nr:formate dehydrogenase accessory sulfurtransferase FdhD [Gammaproteobacteria bacterium]
MDDQTGVKKYKVEVWSNQAIDQKTDSIAEELPIALVYNDVSHAVMMATPTELEAFAIGFSLSEGIIKNLNEIYDIQIDSHPEGVEVALTLSNQRFSELKDRRRSITGRTGCGICGSESLQQVRLTSNPVSAYVEVSHSAINNAVAELTDKQPLQAKTGAVHGAAWCNSEGKIIEICEDIGRHNALDKLIGTMARKEMLIAGTLNAGFVLVSSRASYEMVQKTAMINASVLVAVSAATTMAIELAEQLGISLIGFARDKRHVTYVRSSK